MVPLVGSLPGEFLLAGVEVVLYFFPGEAGGVLEKKSAKSFASSCHRQLRMLFFAFLNVSH
ncbi:MAG: hypothetical protein ACD_17C00419G0001 [uncultured bacterium]|nr:MAG: hypothetical protein ACD_17C00419G0001 [uncultured bacterium]